MSSESKDAKRFGDYVQDSTRSQERDRIKSRLHNAIEEANKHISRGQHADAGRILRDVILPSLERLDYSKPLKQYHGDVHPDDDLPWHWQEFKWFLATPGKYIQAAEGGRRSQTRSPAQVIERALESAESITTYIGITARELQNRVDVHGFSGKIGEHLQDYEMDLGDPVKAVSTQAGALKTLFVGQTGFGKSCGLEKEAEDYYQQNFQSGRDYKVIDLAGLRDGENWFYDIPQKQKPLRDIREEMDLPADFTEADDHENPRLEILAPMTPGLSEEELPYDTESEEFVVQPFVVPASELKQTLLVAFIAERLSDGQEETVRSAYESVDRDMDDWSLKDLADEIRDRDELSPKDKSTAVNVLKSLQDVGFIRTKDHPNCIDWRDIFTDTETITVFTQAKCENKISKLITFAYLLHGIVRCREQMSDIPQAVLLMRELWKIAPHKQRQSNFPLVAALQEATAQMLAEILRENRHSGLHFLADTQHPKDLAKAVRELFNRYVVYSADFDTVKEVFEWSYNSRYKSFWNTMSAKAGEAGIIGQVEPAIDKRDIEFLSPVRYAPPAHHHRISPGDDVGMTPDLNGWQGRCRHHDHEELRRPCDVDGVAWDDSLPVELSIEAAQAPSHDQPDVEQSPVAAFVDRCTAPADIGSYVHKPDLYDAFNEFLKKHKKDRWDFDLKQNQVQFGQRFKDAFPEDIDNKKRKGTRAFVGVVLTTEGQTLLDNSRVEVESSAAPLSADD